jgi:hypothetical protein
MQKAPSVKTGGAFFVPKGRIYANLEYDEKQNT